MSSWSTKRQIGYAAIAIGFLAIVVGVPIFLMNIGGPASCFDGIKNGNERGVDCGGSCSKPCLNEARAPFVLWARPFKVTGGLYNAVAMVENRNVGIWAAEVPYSFKFFDSNNLLILEKRGTMDIPPQSRVPIFEGGVNTGKRIPAKTFFEFIGTPKWRTLAQPLETPAVREEKIENTGSSPRLSADIVNNSVKALEDFEVVALVYNKDGNALAASKTLVERIEKDSVKKVVFTWPESFLEEVGRLEIIPLVYPE